MKIRFKLITSTLLLTAICLSASAQGTAFTYQGRLNSGAGAANGTYDLRFGLYDAATTGIQQGTLLTNSAVALSNGLFMVTLDFGSQFPGGNRWLEIGVRTNGNGTFTTLSPRQRCCRHHMRFTRLTLEMPSRQERRRRPAAFPVHLQAI